MARKTKNKSRKNKSRKNRKSRKNARGLTRPKNLSSLDISKKNNDGEIASSPVLKLIPDLPQDPKNQEWREGVKLREKWLKKQDEQEYLNAIKKYGIEHVHRRKNFHTPLLSDSTRNLYLNEVAKQNNLKPSTTWIVVKKKRNKHR